MNYARFAGDFISYAENARFVVPVSFDNLKARLPVDSVGVQVAGFRGERLGETDVSVFADIPTARLLHDTDVAQALLETGFFLTDAARRSVVESRDSSVIRLDRPDAVAERAWHRAIPPGDYMYRVEARQRVSGRSARGLAAVSVRVFTPGAFELSDILLARRIGLKSAGSKPRGRGDLIITPNGSLTYAPGDTIYLYWETYGLKHDSTGSAHARVQLGLRVDKIQRRNTIEVIVGGLGDALGLTAKGDDRISLSYERTIPPDPGDRAPDYLAVAIGKSPAGTYTLDIQVTDLLTQKTTSQQRVITVRDR